LESVDKLVAAARNAESPLEAARLCTEVVRQNMTYAPRVTDVHTTATDAWLTKQGVCQDYSHIALSLLRSLGIPARYVSGYHYTGNGEIGVPVEVESHAWVEAWTGDWIPFDPTNGKEVDECYVVTAYGRDYGDVSPMRGIFSGGRSKSVEVRVTLTRKHR
jgi:transglutaminase-like putative cysteine protease